ncbi:LuxR C-terminal-related transcriptional regulator [Antribacter gilvus]|uniref:LuxR C-terminal-related transcriptional regulator n=1 Tax=Antribacter gilvus TaxID=2304675 RepID=UPI000F797505|nr:LuxR C-terminal-related transcriptional regulator [Antribacter gilvus]
MLEILGLTATAEAVYLEMLRTPEAGVDNLAQTVGQAPEDVRGALDELARMALVQESQPGSSHLRAVSPAVGIPALLAREQAQLARRNQEIEEGRVALAQLLAAQSDLRQEPDVEVLKSVQDVRDRLVGLTRGCTTQWRSFVPTRKTTPAGIAASRPLGESLLGRGVQMRTVYLESIRNNPDTWAHAVWLRDHGAEIRLAPAIPIRLHLIDDDYALVPQWQAEAGTGAVLLTAPGIVAALAALFQHVWRSSNPLGASRSRDGHGLSAQECELLRLWAKGSTDESAAHRLGVSVRTVRRLSSALMERLDATSRFQAGALAVQRGWLTVDDLT